MTDKEILLIAEQQGWNMEHTATNWMLVQFARAIETAIKEKNT